mgnify:CR=1 FL=1
MLARCARIHDGDVVGQLAAKQQHRAQLLNEHDLLLMTQAQPARQAGGARNRGDQPAALADIGATLLKEGKPVGVVTFGMRSPLNNHSVGIARMPVDCAVPGTRMTVRNKDGVEIPCTAEEMPFYDKDKLIRSAKG